MTVPATTSVPFRVREVHGGWSEAGGLIYVEGDDVVIEVQVKLLSLFQRDPEVHRFELVDLDEVRCKRGLRNDRLMLRTRPMDVLAGIPGAAEGELCLVVKRKCRADLDRLLDRLSLWRRD